MKKKKRKQRKSNENFYAMSEALPLSGYETPMSEGVYSSGYANMYA